MGAGASIGDSDRENAKQLIQIIGTTTGKDRTDAMSKIFELASGDGAKLALCQPSTGFVTILLSILNKGDDSFASSWAVSIIGRLSASVKENKEYLSAPENNVVPALLKVITMSNCKDNAYVFFGNVILNPVTVPYLLSEKLGLVEIAKKEIETNPDYKFPYTFFANAVTIMSNAYAKYFIRIGVHEVITRRLVQAGPDPTKWADRNTGCIYRAMGFVTSFTTLPDGRNAVRELRQKDFFLQLLQTKEKERMQATIIISNLYGRDEGDTSTNALLLSNPGLLQLLVNLLASILNYGSDSNEVAEYKRMGLAFGVTKMRDASSTLRCLSLADKNKQPMLQNPTLMTYVLQAVQLFIDNSPECGAIYQGFQSYAGGGGKDFESIENFLELLLQLSFGYEDDEQLQNAFNLPSYQLPAKLKALLDLPPSRMLPFEARQYALQLLKRLEPYSMPKLTNAEVKSVTLIPSSSKGSLSAAAAGAIPQHIMLSYAWAANKSYVVQLGQILRNMGYDVWRDEEGSSLVPPMSGDIVETMAEAIQHSHLVVICVSREYKDSTNCRAEAKYARARSQSHDLKLAYVMMDQNYTTNSKPQGVDGWLGFMVGTELWYSLWDSNFIDSTAKGIADLAKHNAKLLTNQQLNSNSLTIRMPKHDESHPIISSPIPQNAGKDYNTAWECLNDPKKAQDADKLKNLLDELGLYSPDELQYLEPDQLQQLVALLKPIPQKKVKSLIGI